MLGWGMFGVAWLPQNTEWATVNLIVAPRVQEIGRIMGTFQVVLIVASFLCSLVAGFLFAFAVVVMPGIRRLSDREFIRAFQVIDGVIQNNQPLFLLVWVGSALALVAAVVLGFGAGQLDEAQGSLMIVAALVYLLGVQLPTIAINVPLNNRLQTLDVDVVNEAAQEAARRDLEAPWNRWNSIRTVLASVATVLLMTLLLGLR